MHATFNPCCGVKLKTAIITIGVVDIINGILFIAFGATLESSKEGVPAVLRTQLEVINLLVRPVVKTILGLVLYLSAKFHMKKEGVLSIFGCASWLLGQLGLLGITVTRMNTYATDARYIQLLHKSGATTLESFAILGSVLPFLTMGVLAYEIVSVGFFIIKINHDRKIVRAAEIALKEAQEGVKNIRMTTNSGHSVEVASSGVNSAHLVASQSLSATFNRSKAKKDKQIFQKKTKKGGNKSSEPLFDIKNPNA